MFKITTDSACDIKSETLASWGVAYRPLTLKFEGEDALIPDDAIDVKEFYDRMRAGGISKTQAANSEAFAELFTSILEQGYDILHLGFSSGLSTTYNAARLAGKQLEETYPDRKIVVIDGLKVDEIKTRPFKAFLEKVGVTGKALVVTENVDTMVIKSARNLPGVTTTTATILSPYMILTSGKLVVDKAALAKIEEVFA